MICTVHGDDHGACRTFRNLALTQRRWDWPSVRQPGRHEQTMEAAELVASLVVGTPRPSRVCERMGALA